MLNDCNTELLRYLRIDFDIIWIESELQSSIDSLDLRERNYLLSKIDESVLLLTEWRTNIIN